MTLASIALDSLKTITPHAAIDCHIPPTCAGQRLDQALANLLPAYSRSRLQQWLKCGALQVNGSLRRGRDVVRGGEHVQGAVPLALETPAVAQDMPLTVLYEDEELLVINKPAGLVVHPAVGNRDGTLVNALLHHRPQLAHVPRAGVVHRLDKDTTGLLVVAASLAAHTSLVAQLQARQVRREYLALVQGVPIAGGTVNAPLGRHPVDRQRMAVTVSGKPAITHYQVLRRFAVHALLQVQLETGRTHQIRVHMAHLRFPLLGDAVYGQRLRRPPVASAQCLEVVQNFRRQALHAERLAFTHPGTGLWQTWQAAAPADFQQLVSALAQHAVTGK